MRPLDSTSTPRTPAMAMDAAPRGTEIQMEVIMNSRLAVVARSAWPSSSWIVRRS